MVTQCLNNQEQYVARIKRVYSTIYSYVHVVYLLSPVFVMYRLGSEGSLWSTQGQMVVKVVVDSLVAINQ